MNIILDTHVLIWWYDNPLTIKEEARKLIEDKSNTVFLSATVTWEIYIKVALGKLKIPKGLVEKAIDDFEELPISINHTILISGIKKIHNDPFDHILIAQALYGRHHLMTRDPEILKYPVKTILA